VHFILRGYHRGQAPEPFQEKFSFRRGHDDRNTYLTDHDFFADVDGEVAYPVMILRHERASAVRIAVNSNRGVLLHRRGHLLDGGDSLRVGFAAVELAVERNRGVDQRQVGERLREVSELLACGPDLL
jgi:hypothetical protein